jgi:glucose-6-phosphate-specific signal transduction histidine kinase
MLEQQSNVIKIFLDDNGRGLVASSGNGSGLQGMRERLVSYGGLVELSVLAQGCRLAISFNPSFKEITND